MRNASRKLFEPLESRTLFATLPPGFVDELVTAGLDHPVAIAFAPDGRAFVTEQRGNVRVIDNGQLLPTPFTTFDVSSSGERGVLGITLDPDFADNHYVYIFHTTKTPNVHNQVSRFTADGNVAAPGSEQTIFDLDPLSSNSFIHNGGGLHFGADGKLYISAGENGFSSKAQSMTTTLGKILRVNPDGTIPTDNPFYGTATGNNRAIWALGFRNPYTFAVDPASGRMFINDVGAASWEEINEGTAGANYGWPKNEGPVATAGFTAPFYAYPHGGTSDPHGTSITGGTFYNAATGNYPADYADDYYFVDGTNPWIYRIDPATKVVQQFADQIGPAVNIQAAPDGSLYYVGYTAGEVHKISFVNTDTPPQITRQPANVSVAEGAGATFTVEAFGQEPISYQWRRDGDLIDGATSASFTIGATAAADNGAAFDCVITNDLGTVTSSAASLSLIVDTPPVATILTPKVGQTYRAGQAIKFKGTGTDLEDGKLPASAYTWEIIFHHDQHTHPFYPATSGKKAGSVRIPRVGETSTNVWYRVHLTVTDSQGISSTTFADVHPQTVTINVASAPAGLTTTLDGAPRTTPFSFDSVVGIERELGVDTLVQQFDGDAATYTFKSWKGGKGSVFHFNTPARSRSYLATFIPGS